ncbi:MAG TPA: GntR family transcriptional regulator [Halanaerobiaceae bacterium]|nr:GntR family transcriptional regulator [Bacillota bacterium]HHU91538.1 GntR family transcriptional regulator [Halanaerobiaceae bacterium]HOA41257.1 GntR family transcriptional regulator [Halanaerobiales bacterium]HPZ63255.1 GntR family transcriptional regulator [Halanaerobiales bacterium]HQD04481.1 GntR family transcriptional regulator [Halanaerobiales bacterium]
MELKNDSTTPIYIQIAELIEDQILEGIIKEEEQVYSTNELSSLLHVNPATARKGLNLLVEEGILYKKRGMGMFVSFGATRMIKAKRINSFFRDYILEMLQEGEKLGIGKDEIIKMIKEYKGER